MLFNQCGHIEANDSIFFSEKVTTSSVWYVLNSALLLLIGLRLINLIRFFITFMPFYAVLYYVELYTQIINRPYYASESIFSGLVVSVIGFAGVWMITHGSVGFCLITNHTNNYIFCVILLKAHKLQRKYKKIKVINIGNSLMSTLLGGRENNSSSQHFFIEMFV